MANINQSTLSIFPSRQSRCNVTELRTKRKIAIMSTMMHRKDSLPYESTDYEHEVLKAWKCQQKLVYIHQWWHDYWRSYMAWIAIGSKNSLRCGQMWSYLEKPAISTIPAHFKRLFLCFLGIHPTHFTSSSDLIHLIQHAIAQAKSKSISHQTGSKSLNQVSLSF